MAGLDIGQCINGFVYHTKYDRIDVIPRAALQNTGDNLLGLVRTLSNATELRNPSVGYSYTYGRAGLFYLEFPLILIRQIQVETPPSLMSWDCISLPIRPTLV